MKIRKSSIFKHLFLILITVFILFPLFWVISTSLRRDNAAFSTKLLSSRMTFQHYADLLFPSKNVPVAISEIKKIVNVSGEYKNKDVASLESDLEYFIKKLEDEYSKTESILGDTKNNMMTAEEYLFLISNSYYQEFKTKKTAEIEKIKANVNSLLKNKGYGSYLKYDFITGLSSFNLDYTHKEFMKENFSEIGMSISEYENRITSEADGIYKSFDAFIIENGHRLPESDIKDLRQVLYDYDFEFYDLNFKYSKWNREILVKYLNKFKKTLDDENLTGLWDILVEDIKSHVKNIEEIIVEGSEYLHESVKEEEPIVSAMESLIEKYNDLSIKLEQDIGRLNLLQTEIENANLSVMDIGQKEKILLEQVKANDIFLEEGINIIVSLMDENELRSTEVLFVNKIEDIIRKTEEINKLLIENGIEKSEEAKFLYNSLNYLISKKENLVSRSGYAYLEDAVTVINNSFLLLKPILEDLNGNFSHKATYLKNITDLNSEISELKEEISNSKAAVSDLESEYTEIKNMKKSSELLKDYLTLHGNINDVTDEKTMFYYLKQLKKTAEGYGISLENISEYPMDFLINSLEIESAISMVNTFEKQYEFIKGGINKSYDAIREFEKRIEYYLKLKISGSPISVLEVNNIELLSQTIYEGFSADLNRIGRKSIDFTELDSALFSDIYPQLRAIDRNIFDIMQIWMKKPDQQFMRWLFNTIIISIFTAALTVIICALGAYPFSRMRFRGRKNGLLILLLVQMFPTFMGMIALYALLRYIGGVIPFLSLDTLGGLTFVYLGNIAFNMWLLKGYFDTIPDTLEESAMIDGATRFQTFWKIVMPLATPILAVVFLLVFMTTFQEFILARIVLQSPENYTFAVGLQSFAYGPYQMEWGLFTAAAMIGAIPMLVLFLFMQKYLVSGLTQGAVKG